MTKFSPGQDVRLVSNPGRVGVITAIDEVGVEPEYTVFFSAHEQATYPERSLLALDEDAAGSRDPAALLAGWRLGDARDFRAFLTLTKLERPLADNLYSFVSSRTERLPYQFKPVLKLLEGPYSRLLIADEVGLGKTIEAGIILTELQQRARLDNILILCPSALTRKWRAELRERFDLEFEILDGLTFRERAIEAAAGTSDPLRAIGSLELLRRAENLDTLTDENFPIDVLVVDEAHHLRNRGTKTNALGDLLAQRSAAAVFLTATPLNLGEQDFFELMRMLVPQEFDSYETFLSRIEPNEHVNDALRTMRASTPPDFAAALRQLRRVEGTSQGPRIQRMGRYQLVKARLASAAQGPALDRDGCVAVQRELIELNSLSHVFTRTKKREVQEHFPTRKAASALVELSTSERELYDAVTNWAIEYYGEHVFAGRGFVTTMIQRQAASCLPAMKRKVLKMVSSGFLRLDPEEIDELEDAGIEPDEHELSIELDADARDATARLVEACHRYDDRDAKFERFLEALRELIAQGQQRVLVFSFFVGTIDYLAERLADIRMDAPLQTLKLYGPMSTDQRYAAIKRFRESAGPTVMLSSEVGSEGLDFQFCSAMVNYDLPWNPMRVEQRIGRLDRYGQTAEVIQILNMRIEDTVEDRIFFRLFERINIFERSIGDLEAILGEQQRELAELQREVLRNELSPEQQVRKTEQVADVIVRRQQELEEFDRSSKKFLGNDDVFLDRFNDIEQSRKYVTPEELRELVEGFLDRHFPKVTLRPVDGEPKVFELWAGAERDFGRSVLGHLAHDAMRARFARIFLARFDDDERLRVTFDPHTAMQRRELEFISIHHPLVRAIRQICSGDVDLLPTGGLRVTVDGDLPVGVSAFFIYELEATGIKDRVEFVPVVVRAELVDVNLSDAFPRLLAGAHDVVADRPLMSEAELCAAHEVATRWIAEDRDRREAELRQTNDEVIDAQLESLWLSSERQALYLREQIETQTDPSILRMREAQLRNQQLDLEERVRRLEAKRGVSVGRRLVAAGAMVVER
ncbi:MAG: hypothetical protein DYH12_02995 [Sorangiineae bacterium PRO1]|nr:hypothetical protein [Sorangiineae bacterium PRO1]